MKKMKNFFAAVVRVWHLPFIKYSLISVVGIVLVGFVGENSLMAHLRNKFRIGELNDEIEKYETQYQSDMRKIRELNHNPKAMERIARERYFMKEDDEDIFVLSDDRDNQLDIEQNETAQ
jgi:cell division protein FtsB